MFYETVKLDFFAVLLMLVTLGCLLARCELLSKMLHHYFYTCILDWDKLKRLYGVVQL